MLGVASKVALVELDGDARGPFQQAAKLVGGIDNLNSADRTVVVKVGVYNHKKILPGGHATVDVVSSIVDSFNRAPRILLVESDNYVGKGSERLQVWKKIFSERVSPFNLSTDTETREVEIAGEKIGLSHILFKPNVFIGTHVLRRFEKGGTLNLMSVGSILKNLLGLMPERKKARFHKKLVTVLLDAYEAIGGIDLAVLDATYTYLGVGKTYNRVKTNVVLAGRDAIAVEAVGASLVGLNPEEMPVIREAVKRGLGEGDSSSRFQL